MRRPLSRSLVPALALALLAAAGLPSTGCGPSECVFVAVVPESGSLAPYGRELRRGMEVAVSEINRRGGAVSGSEPITLRVVDDGSDAERAVAEVRGALAGDAVAVVGPVGDEAFRNLALVSGELPGAALSPYSGITTEQVGTPHLFRNYPAATLEMGHLVKLLRRDLFLKDIVVFTARSHAGRAYKTAFEASFERLRGNVQASVGFRPGLAADAAAELVADLRTRPGDGVVLLCSGEDAVTLLAALRGIEYREEVFTTSAFHHPAFRESAGANAQDVMYVAPAWNPDAPRAASFVDAYRAAHGEPPSVWAALGHDAVLTLASALDEVGGLYRADLPPTLRSSRFRAEGVLGVTEFDASGEMVARELEVHGVRDGQALPWAAYEQYWAERGQGGTGL